MSRESDDGAIPAKILISIRDLPPLEEGGVEARKGLHVQDHVAAGYCIRMLGDLSLKEVWCETQDDITLIWDTGDGERVEFVQVKSHQLNQLWSVSKLCERENKGKQGTSIIERSLAYDRCKEGCSFRVVTARPVQKELEVLTYELPSEYRSKAGKEFEELWKKVKTQVGDYRSANGNDYAFWLSRIVWEVIHSVEAIENKNLIDLGAFLYSQSEYAAPDQLREHYIRLLRKVHDAGAADWRKDPKAKKLKRSALLEWIQGLLQEALHPGATGGQKAREKMEYACLPADTIIAALEERTRYIGEVYSHKYLAIDDRSLVEGEVAAVLQSLRAQLDAGTIADSGAEFHALCLANLDELAQTLRPQPPLSFVHGCMYSMTDRCVHRFRRVSA